MYSVPFEIKGLPYLDGLKVVNNSNSTDVELLIIFMKASTSKDKFYTNDDKQLIMDACDEVDTDKLLNICKRSKFKGHCKKFLVNHCEEKSLLLVGLGEREVDPFTVKDIIDKIAPNIVTINPQTISVQYSSNVSSSFASDVVQQMLVQMQTIDRQCSVKAEPLNITTLHVKGQIDVEDIKLRAKVIQISKEMTDSPPNYCFPEALSRMMENDSKMLGFECKVYGYDECRKMGMGSFCAVAQGMETSPRDSQLVHLIYKNGTPKKRICLVGKGVTMDTGGINVKSYATKMHMMHTDMGGSSIHYGTFRYIVEKKFKDCEIHCMLGFVENLIDSTAVIPGDIVTAMNGTTIEVRNTDAEGRLVMCDLVNLFEKIVAEKNDGVDAITITCCTLTGCQIMTFGTELGCFITDEEDLVQAMEQGHRTTVDNYWRLPMHSSYNRYIENDRCDLINVPEGVPMPGACNTIVGALFMNKFIKNTRFMHCDVAGPVYNGRATGFGCSGMISCIKTLTGN